MPKVTKMHFQWQVLLDRDQSFVEHGFRHLGILILISLLSNFKITRACKAGGPTHSGSMVSDGCLNRGDCRYNTVSYNKKDPFIKDKCRTKCVEMSPFGYCLIKHGYPYQNTYDAFLEGAELHSQQQHLCTWLYIHGKINMYTCIHYVYMQYIYVYMYTWLCIHARWLCIHVHLVMYTCKIIMHTCLHNHVYMQDNHVYIYT